MQLFIKTEWPTQFELSLCTANDGKFPAISLDELHAILMKSHRSDLRFVHVTKPNKKVPLDQSERIPEAAAILKKGPKKLILLSKDKKEYSFEINGREYQIKCKEGFEHVVDIENNHHFDQIYNIGDRDIVAVIRRHCNDPILEGLIIDAKVTRGGSDWTLIHSNKLVSYIK